MKDAMTTLDQWRALLADIEEMPPKPRLVLVHDVCGLARDIYGSRYSEIAGLFEMACMGDLTALGAVVALVEREMPGATRTSSIIPGRSCKVMIGGEHYGTRDDGQEPLAWLAAFARAKVAGLEAAA